MAETSITVTPSVGSGVTLNYRCRTVPMSTDAAHVIIRFPSMSGGVLQRGAQRYERITCESWLYASSVAGLVAQHQALATALGNLRGTSRDSITITYSDGTSKTVSSVVQVNALQSGEVSRYGTSYVKDVTFSVERLK